MPFAGPRDRLVRIVGEEAGSRPSRRAETSARASFNRSCWVWSKPGRGRSQRSHGRQLQGRENAAHSSCLLGAPTHWKDAGTWKPINLLFACPSSDHLGQLAG
jgi:hypothetical protein